MRDISIAAARPTVMPARFSRSVEAPALHDDSDAFDNFRRLLDTTVRTVGGVLRAWRDRIRQRSELAMLSDRDLLDFGCSRSDVDTEIRKAFWQA